ncbi:hypothetical protein MEQU1_000750 [Malassezia equina]|uniref:Altered inheritance of mitochondria protein 6 n=1 Tax=Malassezia equina TaxID=1381935 RepID=A0AAF0IZ42_9BASI|nr:hypothetical protein MEQU1_000750 [Malassezia equina]
MLFSALSASVALLVPSVLATDPIKPNRTVLFHSHNDYKRPRPVYDAFDHKFRSFEADVWWDKDAHEFYVAHTIITIDHSKTFQTQMLDRVLKIMEGNYSSEYPKEAPHKFLNDPNNQPTSEPDWYKYYAEGFGGVRPIQLLLEIKSNDGKESWLHLMAQLKPLRERGWLTKWENGKIHYGPVIVVGTGGTPAYEMAPKTSRDYFFDCPAGSLNDTVQTPTGLSFPFNSTLCPMSSKSYIDVPESNLGLLPPPPKAPYQFHREIVETHRHNSTTRFYGVLAGSLARIDDFNMLIQQGSDWLNTDVMSDEAAYNRS